MGYLRSLLDKTEPKRDDTYTQALLKGMAEGVLEGLVIVGAIQLTTHQLKKIKK